MTRQEASVLTWLRSKVGRRAVSPVVMQRPPGRHKAVVKAIGAAFRAPFASRPARPVRRAPLFEPLEPRVLLSAELPVIPPQPDMPDTVLAAPFEFGDQGGDNAPAQILLQGFDGAAAPLPDLPAQTPEAIKFSDDWGQSDLTESADGTTEILDFSAVTKDLQFTVHADGSVDVTDGENTAAAANVAKLVGGSGNDTFKFENLPAKGLVIETDGSGKDVLDLSALQQDLSFVTHIDGSLSVSDADHSIRVDGAIAALPGTGSNTFVEEKAPVIAGTVTAGVFSGATAKLSLAAYAATHAAPSQIVVIDPSVANYESLLKNLRATPVARSHHRFATRALPSQV